MGATCSEREGEPERVEGVSGLGREDGPRGEGRWQWAEARSAATVFFLFVFSFFFFELKNKF